MRLSSVLLLSLPLCSALQAPKIATNTRRRTETPSPSLSAREIIATSLASLVLACSLALASPALAASDQGASSAANTKIAAGGASSASFTGRSITITRGVNLDNSDFSNQNLKGVAFQQSVVRYANFANTNLQGASFFDATLDGTNFESADLTMANVEMAQFNMVNLKNAIMKEVYVSGATLFNGIKNIENTDWSDT
jgi:uncharacterized protein YjbI with pentapeptide repeats